MNREINPFTVVVTLKQMSNNKGRKGDNSIDSFTFENSEGKKNELNRAIFSEGKILPSIFMSNYFRCRCDKLYPRSSY